MRDPLGLKEFEENDVDIIKFGTIPEFDIEDYDLDDPKELKKYILSVKKICRASFEYRMMIGYLRENVDMNKCSFFKYIGNENYHGIKIEVHHHPFTLEDIIKIVYNKRLQHRESLDEEMVAKEVMYLHYSLMIGLLPLSTTIHELVHNQYLFIPNQKVMGKYFEFYELYKDYMDPEMQDTYDRTVQYSQDYDELKQQPLLNRKYIYIDLSGELELPTYQYIIDKLNEGIKRGEEEKKKKPRKQVIRFVE